MRSDTRGSVREGCRVRFKNGGATFPGIVNRVESDRVFVHVAGSFVEVELSLARDSIDVISEREYAAAKAGYDAQMRPSRDDLRQMGLTWDDR